MNPFKKRLHAQALCILALCPATLAFSGFEEYDWTAGDGFWSNPSNWNQPTVPNDFTHEAHIGRSTGQADVTADMSVNLHMMRLEDACTLDSNGYLFQTNLWFTVDGEDTKFFARNPYNHGGNATVITPSFSVQNGGEVEFIDGGIYGETFNQANDSIVSGYGNVGAERVYLDGPMMPHGGTLEILATDEADWDGLGEDGRIDLRADNTTLRLEGNWRTSNDWYTGSIKIGHNSRFHRIGDWAVEGPVQFYDDGPGFAVYEADTTVKDGAHFMALEGDGEIRGTTNFEDGIIEVTPDATLFFDGPVTMEPASIGYSAENARLMFGGDTVIRTRIFGEGDVETWAGVTFGGTGPHIDLLDSTFDWDGAYETGNTVIEPGSAFRVDAKAIEADGGDGAYDGDIHNQGTMIFDLTDALFGLEGELKLDSTHPDAPFESYYAGTPLVVKDGGSVEANGRGRLYPETTFESGAQIRVPGADDVLNIHDTAWGDVNVSGLGQLVTNGNLIVNGHSTVAVDFFYWDGPAHGNHTIISEDSSLTVSTNQMSADPANDGMDAPIDVYGQLHSVHPWRMDGELKIFNGAIVSGAELSIADGAHVHADGSLGAQSQLNAPAFVWADGLLSADLFTTLAINAELKLGGNSISTELVNGSGTVRPNAGIRVLSNSVIGGSWFDWDGQDGEISANNYTIVEGGAGLTIVSNVIDSSLTDGYDGTIDLHPGAWLKMNNGTGNWRLDGTMNMAAGSWFDGSDFELDGTLNGGGAVYDANVQWDGTMAPSTDDGGLHFEFGDVTMSASAELYTQISGPAMFADYGPIRLHNGAGQNQTLALAGTLRLDLVDGYVPTVGTEFTICSAPTINLAFHSLDTPGFEVQLVPGNGATPDRIVATYIGGGSTCAADLNGDGLVNVDDMLIIFSNWGTAGGDINDDGTTDVSDLLLIFAEWGVC